MIFPLFVAMTLLEIYVLASVGDAIGGLSTVLLVVITAFIGSFLLKQQGWATMAKAQNAMMNGQTPAVEMLEGVVILISGVLLLTPGFITDTIGLLGLLPFSRRYFINKILTKNAAKMFTQKKSIFIRTSSNDSKKSNKDNTIEGEFWED
ncbi:Cytoplasmic membrane protein FsxA [Bathymodiolus thermophilus thioautotrophic gill symbiont]|uniref:Cytoplasmic membrane protein FsxA n=1 Tax=Bathymodiolus thermophilus thioautotrophic gill symbiont TaxID=2360 RepID=A0A3G3IJA4_9GAMM|nr:FxsA family protein [Bathymodiolus thermophilus thioautotrophic gill symbiont]AYQ55923.1 exclusion protein FxsA [Bathymodiolus thermophilus thioautotrophic gill symbiont]CAB5493949.1 Cytoplasmic membrane protein FsxA [Bathymodiolus thermophilus thioautotrophic gill symbiont]CAB5498726.1 Cytoplasmic membrane protein FsxA [Bathymodiolus thermophilus thioautotrophic gill symbiont]